VSYQRGANEQRRDMPAMSDRVAGATQLVSAAILVCRSRAGRTNHAHRRSLTIRNTECGQFIFTEQLPGLVDPRSRQTRRVAGILRLLGHGVGGRPGKRRRSLPPSFEIVGRKDRGMFVACQKGSTTARRLQCAKSRNATDKLLCRRPIGFCAITRA
jgi:hypothetical protein